MSSSTGTCQRFVGGYERGDMGHVCRKPSVNEQTGDCSFHDKLAARQAEKDALRRAELESRTAASEALTKWLSDNGIVGTYEYRRTTNPDRVVVTPAELEAYAERAYKRGLAEAYLEGVGLRDNSESRES